MTLHVTTIFLEFGGKKIEIICNLHAFMLILMKNR